MFVRKYNPDEEMSATMAVAKCYSDHGWAVYFTQESRRCFPLDTTFHLTDEEALWTSLSSWATFQPYRAGHLFYPNEFSHVFEKYWDYLDCLEQHPDFSNESEDTRYCMALFSRGLSGMASQGKLRPSAEAEAEEGDVLIVEHAAVSRLRQIQEGLGYWEEHRRSADTGSGGPAPGQARTML